MFNSIEEIRERFQITAVERQDIRGSLLRILAGVHPDKNGGTFKNDSDRELYNSASAAVEFLDREPKEITLSRTALESLIASLTAQNKPAETAYPSAALHSVFDSSMMRLRNRTLFPRISATAVAVVLSGIWLFPKTMAEHPILKQYTGSSFLTLLWLASLSTAVLAWLLATSSEHRLQSLKEQFTSTQFQRQLAQRLWFQISSRGNRVHDSLLIRRDEIEDLMGILPELPYFSNRLRYRRFNIFDPLGLFHDRTAESSIWENLVDIVIGSLVKENLLKPVGSTIQQQYQVNRDANFA